MTSSPAEGPSNFRFVTPLAEGPEQDALVEVVDRALDGLPGPWSVGVCRGNVVNWVILSIFRDDGFECSLFLDEPMKQTALFVREQLEGALRMYHGQGWSPAPGPVKQSSS
jgi:hypothetical protein